MLNRLLILCHKFRSEVGERLIEWHNHEIERAYRVKCEQLVTKPFHYEMPRKINGVLFGALMVHHAAIIFGCYCLWPVFAGFLGKSWPFWRFKGTIRET